MNHDDNDTVANPYIYFRDKMDMVSANREGIMGSHNHWLGREDKKLCHCNAKKKGKFVFFLAFSGPVSPNFNQPI